MTRYNSKALHGPLAQRSEHTPYKGGVDGSNPSWSTNTHGEIPKWLKGLVLKTGSGVTPSWGSNPHFSASFNVISPEILPKLGKTKGGYFVLIMIQIKSNYSLNRNLE